MANDKYLSDDHEDFTVSARESIINIMRELSRENITLSGTFNSGMEVLLTAVLGVDPKEGMVYLDINANEERNQQFLKSSRVIFYAFSNSAKIQWASYSVESTRFDGSKAFRVPIPEKLQRVQRRSAYRVATPITNPVICRIPVAPGHEITVPLVDICVEGISVVLPSAPEPAIQKNALFKNCRLDHENLGITELTLSVQSIFDVTMRNGTISQHAGLEFVNIRQRDQPVIQRFVFKLELLKRATRRSKSTNGG